MVSEIFPVIASDKYTEKTSPPNTLPYAMAKYDSVYGSYRSHPL